MSSTTAGGNGSETTSCGQTGEAAGAEMGDGVFETAWRFAAGGPSPTPPVAVRTGGAAASSPRYVAGGALVLAKTGVAAADGTGVAAAEAEAELDGTGVAAADAEAELRSTKPPTGKGGFAMYGSKQPP